MHYTGNSKLIVKSFLILPLSFLVLVGTVFSQTSEDPRISTPEITFITVAGSEEAVPEPGTTGAEIIASIPEDQQCECGARFEAKLSDSNDWTVLGLYAPMETGDEYEQYQWSYTSNFFEANKKYDVRVLIYDRIGTQSEYSQKQLTMTPYKEAACSDGVFKNLTKSAVGEDEDALIFFSWDRVCTHSKEANRYKVFKNGQEVGESDSGANNIALAGTPDGSTWKIEASGDEPPSANIDVIKNCDTLDANGNVTYSEIVTKMAGKSVSVPVVKVNKCQIVGTWLRAIIEFQGYVGGYQPPCGPPRGWLNCALTGINNNGKPYFNFVTGSTPLPGYPNSFYWKGFVNCGSEGQTVNNPNGAIKDPWNQLPDWRCYSTYSYGSNYITTYTDRAWVNFDLNAPGGASVWPVTTTFTY